MRRSRRLLVTKPRLPCLFYAREAPLCCDVYIEQCTVLEPLAWLLESSRCWRGRRYGDASMQPTVVRTRPGDAVSASTSGPRQQQ